MTDIFLDSLTELAVGVNTSISASIARTRLLNFMTAKWTRDPMRYRFEGVRGLPTLERSARAPRIIMDKTQLAVDGLVDLRDILFPFVCSIDAAPTVTDPDSSDDDIKLVTFQPAINQYPAIKYAGIERVSSDADETATQRAYSAQRGFCMGWSLSEGDGVYNISSNWQLGAESGPEARTASLTEPETPVILPMSECTFQIYDTWAAMVAGTPAESDTLSYGLEFVSGHSIRNRMDGRQDYSKEDGAAGRMLDFTATAYVESALTELVLAEEGKFEDTRYMKIRFEAGEEVKAGYPYFLEIGMACTHADDSLVERDDEGEEGRNTRRLHLQSGGDDANGLFFRVQLHKDDHDAYL